MKFKLAIFSFLLAFAMTPGFLFAQDANTTALKKFVTPDVVGIAYVDLENMDLPGAFELFRKFGFDEGTGFGEPARAELDVMIEDIASMKKAGLSKGYALLRLSDIQARGTSFVMPLAKGSDKQKAIEALTKVVNRMTGGSLPDFKIESKAGAIIAAVGDQFGRLKNESGDDKDNRTDMLKEIEDGSIGVVIFGDEDSRRVAEEMTPPLPGPFAVLNGDLIANGTKWTGISATLGAKPALNIEIEADDEQSAQTYESTIKDALKLAKIMPPVRELLPKSEIKFVFDAIEPKRDGNRVSMSASELTKDMDRLAKVLRPQIQKVREAASRASMQNAVRQHILSILNYEAAYQHFPTQFSVNDAGKPLLSWRVHVLPYLDQNELYKQFNLDEPWDSDHNIKLVDKMPSIYFDHRTGSNENNKKGVTVFQVPAGEGMMFDKGTKVRFVDIPDGSSNTISIVIVPMENAIQWTKPMDWGFDPENPKKGLGDGEIIVSYCDGSVRVLPADYPAEEFRKLIDPKDGEVVEYP